MDATWEKIVAEKKSGGVASTLLQVLTLGIAEKEELWEVEYKNNKTGEVVRGLGATADEADQKARARFEPARPAMTSATV
ncbi:MAG TPA: hypothetical protein VF980_07355 [Thermoanaerobaculia bacterium]